VPFTVAARVERRELFGERMLPAGLCSSAKAPTADPASAKAVARSSGKRDASLRAIEGRPGMSG
jgi:hypothetical protein